MVQALTAAIVALFIGAIAFIVRKIKRAMLGSEFKDLEKVLDKFGSSGIIEFGIAKDEGIISMPFTPTNCLHSFV